MTGNLLRRAVGFFSTLSWLLSGLLSGIPVLCFASLLLALPDTAYAVPDQKAKPSIVRERNSKSSVKVPAKSKKSKTSNKRGAKGARKDSAGTLKADPAYRQLQSSLTKLRDADPETERLREWENLASRYRSYIVDNPNSNSLPGAFFNLGRVSERIYKQHGLLASASRGSLAFSELVRRFPKHSLAAEALTALTQLTAARDSQDESPGRESRVDRVLVNNPSVMQRDPVVVIDPGHGGEDLGAEGVNQVLEKEVVLNISLYLDELLRNRLRAKTVLTRARDVVVPLEARTKIANDNQADLFISIHTNASPKKNATGIETYYLDNTDDRSSLKLAERENTSSRFGRDDLGFMVSDLIQNLKLDESISLAHHLHGSLIRRIRVGGYEVRDLGVKRAPFFVLVGAHMPCVLVEVSFIDHALEGAKLVKRDYQLQVAEGIYRGIRDYFARLELKVE